MVLIVCLPDPRPHGALSCHDCPLIYEVPAYYFTGMDLATCPKRKTCPCGFDPVMYNGCRYDKPAKQNPWNVVENRKEE